MDNVLDNLRTFLTCQIGAQNSAKWSRKNLRQLVSTIGETCPSNDSALSAIRLIIIKKKFIAVAAIQLLQTAPLSAFPDRVSFISTKSSLYTVRVSFDQASSSCSWVLRHQTTSFFGQLSNHSTLMMLRTMKVLLWDDCTLFECVLPAEEQSSNWIPPCTQTLSRFREF